MKTSIQVWLYLARFFLELNFFSDKSRENQNYTFFFPRKSYSLQDSVEKYCRVGQATDDGKAHAPCVLDTLVRKRTLRICNNYCFSTATMVPRTRLSVTLYSDISANE